MKLNCISCGHNIDLDDSYGEYQGLIKCYVCNAVLSVKIEEGNIKSVDLRNLTKTPSEEGSLIANYN